MAENKAVSLMDVASKIEVVSLQEIDMHNYKWPIAVK